MFKKNTGHLQPNLMGLYNTLPESMKRHARKSEEYTFYELIFSNIDEDIFAPLYSDLKSRPNAPINSLVASLILFSRNNWTYEKLFKEIEFNLLTKIALGLDDLETMPFCPATLFNFQNRIYEHFIKTGENLLAQVFDNLTAKQLKKLKIKTDIQRTDSFIAASNIRNYSRLQLLVEMVIRIYRVLSEEDKARFKEQFLPYITKTSSTFIYKLERSEVPKELEKLGKLYHLIFKELSPQYSEHDIFDIFERVYHQHFTVNQDKIEVKPTDKIGTSSIQSPDDLDATYRNKRGKITRGQTISLVETANPDNPINLITDIAVKANNTDDASILNERLASIYRKTPDLKELHFDGGYGNKENDRFFDKYGITPVQSGIKGPAAVVDIKIKQLAENEYQVTCPYQSVLSTPAITKHKAIFDKEICQSCSMANKCLSKIFSNHSIYYFSHDYYLRKRRHEMIKNIPEKHRKIRCNVEATVQEFVHRTDNGKLRVRGWFKTAVFAYTTALAVNFGRIYRYNLNNSPEPGPTLENNKNVKEQLKFTFRVIFQFIFGQIQKTPRFA